MERLLAIDGYNCMRRTGLFEKELDASLESARCALLKLIKKFSNNNRAYARIVVVFDGKSDCPQQLRESRDGRVAIVFSRAGESADEVIRALLARQQGRYRLAVVSDDNYVTNHARVYGADVIVCADFLRRIQRNAKSPETPCEKNLSAREESEITEALRKAWGI